MKKWIVLLSVVGILSSFVFCGTQDESSDEDEYNEYCADWARLRFGNSDDSYVENNVWNRGDESEENYTQCIGTVSGNPDDVSQGVYWNWEWPQSSDVRAYPEIVIGHKPWSTAPVTTQFPFRAADYLMELDFDYTIEAEGVCNVAFTLWTSVDNPPTQGGIANEIMIWTHNQGMSPAGTLRESDISLNGELFDLWVREDHIDNSGSSQHVWTYVAFVAKENLKSGSFNFKEFTDYLISSGFMDSTVYIDSLELGTEIVQGRGKMTVTNFDLNYN